MSERRALSILREVGWVVGSSTRDHPRRDEVKQALWTLRAYGPERLAQMLAPAPKALEVVTPPAAEPPHEQQGE